MNEIVKVLFASCSQDLVSEAIEETRAILPELPLVVVSEFRPRDARWIPYHVERSVADNLALIRATLGGARVRISAVVLEPQVPYGRMRLAAFLLSPKYFLAFNEDFGHFMLRPGSMPGFFRHFWWRCGNWWRWQRRPGRKRFGMPAIEVAAGMVMAAWKAIAPRRHLPLKRLLKRAALPGITVVLPSRDGRELLAAMLPEVVRQLGGIPHEIIVTDNGSSDGTVEFLAAAYPQIIVEHSPAPLSFSAAVNRGIRRAKHAHLCLLNNDMHLRDGFFTALLQAFEEVPDLFCATAQIFFTEGRRRQETGKSIMPLKGFEETDFPARCEEPLAGEDQSYVLWGTGGCSLYDAGRLKALGGMDETYRPAYVEDFDLGVRGWLQGWPTVYVAGAKVIHEHRATTSRYYSNRQLATILEVNYLRLLARAVHTPGRFLRLWNETITRLRILEDEALRQAWRAPLWMKAAPYGAFGEEDIYALGSGEIAVFRGRARLDRTKVLIASSYVPFPLAHGGAVRMFHLMREAARDFDLVLVCFVDELRAVPEELLELCVEVIAVRRTGSHKRAESGRPAVVEEFDSGMFHAALRQTMRKWRPRIAQFEFTQMALYAEDCVAAKTILVEHDVTLDLYRQLLSKGEDWELRRQLGSWEQFETRAWRTLDCIVTMSDKDRAMVLESNPRANAVTLANGVDLDRFRPTGAPVEANRLLFIGSFAHLPNVLAIDFFLREVWPLLADLNPVLHVIAGARHGYFLERYRDRVTFDLAGPGIEVEDFVSDVRPAYERAAVVIAPLLASAGTNIKIMEAMAMGKAVVSTPGGINGLDLEHGRELLVAGNAAEFAAAIRSLLLDEERRGTIEREARRRVALDFDWRAIGLQQKALYESLVAES